MCFILHMGPTSKPPRVWIWAYFSYLWWALYYFFYLISFYVMGKTSESKWWMTEKVPYGVDEERDRMRLHIFVHSPNTHSSQDGLMWKPVCISHLAGRDPNIGAIHLLLLRMHISRKLDLDQRSWYLNQALHYGIWHSTAASSIAPKVHP